MIKLTTIKEILKVAAIEKKRSHKNYLSLVLDIIYSRKKYGTTVCDYMAYGFSMLDKQFKKEYLSSHKLIKLVNKVNNRNLDNKWTSYCLLKEFYHRDIVNLNENKEIEIEHFLKKHSNFFAKTLEGSGGYGVKYITQPKKDLINYLKNNKLIMLEEAIVQHDVLNQINPNCINTLRIASILNQDNSIVLLPSILRVGSGNSKIDNVSSGGFYTLLNDEGVICLEGYYQENLDLIKDQQLIVKKHPLTQINPLNIKIPFYEEALAMVKEMAKKIPDCPIVGWDIAISKDGPKLLEFNAFPGLDMNQNYYFTKIFKTKHIGAKKIAEKQLKLKL